MHSMQLLKPCRYALAVVVLAWLQAIPTSAYTVVTVAPGSAPDLETSFIQATTNQFAATVLKNPLASNTWTLKLYGPNPTYNPPVTQSDLLRSLTAISTGTFIYGFANGMQYQNSVEIGMTAYLDSLCDSATSFNLVQATPETFDKNTCRDVLVNLLDELYQVDLSTPMPIPGEP